VNNFKSEAFKESICFIVFISKETQKCIKGSITILHYVEAVFVKNSLTIAS